MLVISYIEEVIITGVSNRVIRIPNLYNKYNILCKHDTYFSLCDLVNMELSKSSKWFSVNKLSLNVRKTSYMLYGYRHVNLY